MPFNLKNTRATYKQAMNSIFHDMINQFIEVYIDDVIIDSSLVISYIDHFKIAFERMTKKMQAQNKLPQMCFGSLSW